MKIYLAHNYAARIKLRKIVKQLADLGHEVTSRWITDDSHQSLCADTAQADLDDIVRADALLLFVDQFADRPGKGKYVELGYALGINKPAFLFGGDNSCVFYYLPQLKRIESFSELPQSI